MILFKLKIFYNKLKIYYFSLNEKITYFYNYKYTRTILLSLVFMFLLGKNFYDLNRPRDTAYLEKYKSQKNIYILDSGHGKPRTDNCRNKAVREPNGQCFYEWEYNFRVVNEICKMLDERGVFYLRTDSITDQRDLGVMERVKYINRIVDDLESSNLPTETEVLVISIHANGSSKSKEASGLEIFTNLEKANRFFDEASANHFKNQTEALTALIHDYYRQYMPSTNFRYSSKGQMYKESNKAHEGDIAILKRTKTYAVLTENGFFTNDIERELMKTDEWVRRVAMVHVNTILTIEDLDLYED